MQIVEFPCLLKKKEGILQIAGSRIKWAENGNEASFDVSIESVGEILVNSGAKPLLKLSLSSSSVTFNFTSPDSRDKAKSIILALKKELPTSTLSTLIPYRKILLSRDQTLARLHKDLVIDGIISEEQFWKSRTGLLNQLISLENLKMGTLSTSLSDLRATTESSSSDLKFTLTPQVIHQIFLEYPSVKRAYIDQVPTKTNENAFWKFYLTSKYFHKRGVGVTEAGNNFFKNYEIENENREFDSKLFDLESSINDHPNLGNDPDITMKPGKFAPAVQLIKRFNRHSSSIVENTIKHKRVDNSDLYRETLELDDLKTPESESGVLLNIPPRSVVKHESGMLLNLSKPDLSKISLADINAPLVIRNLKEMHKKRKLETNAFQYTGVYYGEIRSRCETVYELLRHFWSSIEELNKSKCTLILKTLKEIEAESYKIGGDSESEAMFMGMRQCIQKAKMEFQKNFS